jgi:7-cyano-7-deazaguanine synthase
MRTSGKKAIVLHSGGMDSSLCLALAIQEFGRENVLSLSITYGQRHTVELAQATQICQDWGVDHRQISGDYWREIADNALINHQIPIEHLPNQTPNTLVICRNGLMAQMGAIYAHHLGADCLYLGVIEVESANSGYRDCSREYMDLVQRLLRIDLGNAQFTLHTPLVKMTKKETLKLAQELGILEYLLMETVSCYEGIRYQGCRQCPACKLRNQGIQEFIEETPGFKLNYPSETAESL